MLTRSDEDQRSRSASCANERVVSDPDAAPLQYIVTFPQAKNHYVDIAATIPTDGLDEIELMMAAWTPGSYLLREYARHVENLTATTQEGAPLSIRKTTKNRWTVETQGEANVLVTYQVYGREMTVRSNWIEADFAMLNGAPTFLTRADNHRRRHDVRVNPPRAWRKVVTGLENHKDSRLHFKAPDYDTLVDSPIIVGNPELHEFEVDKKPHVLLNLGGSGVWDEERSASDTQRLVEEELALWGELPYERYVFMNVLSETGGGLEHKNSTLMMYTRWASRDRTKYLKWLGLVAHEFFHTWNV
ncbi:MAG: peptidase M61, partial [Myxococcota bacterium]